MLAEVPRWHRVEVHQKQVPSGIDGIVTRDMSLHMELFAMLCDYKAQVRTVAAVKGRIRSCRLDERSAHSRDCRNVRSVQKTLHC